MKRAGVIGAKDVFIVVLMVLCAVGWNRKTETVAPQDASAPEENHVFTQNPIGSEENHVDKGDLDGVAADKNGEHSIDPQGNVSMNNFTLNPPLHVKLWGAPAVWLGSYEDEQFNCIAEIYKNEINNRVAIIRFKHVDNIDKFISAVVIGSDEQ